MACVGRPQGQRRPPEQCAPVSLKGPMTRTALNVIAIAQATQAEAVLAAFSRRKPFEFKISCSRLRLYGSVRRIVRASA
jgi:hypothetical protein